MSLLRAIEKRAGEPEQAADERAPDKSRGSGGEAHRGLAFTVLTGTTAPEGTDLLVAVRQVRGAGEANEPDRWVSDEVIDVIAEFIIETMEERNEPTDEE